MRVQTDRQVVLGASAAFQDKKLSARHLCRHPPRSRPARGGRFALWPDIWGVTVVTLGLGRTGPAGLLVGSWETVILSHPTFPCAHFQEPRLGSLAWRSGGGGVPRKSSWQPQLRFPSILTSASFEDSGASTLRPSPSTIPVTGRASPAFHVTFLPSLSSWKDRQAWEIQVSLGKHKKFQTDLKCKGQNPLGKGENNLLSSCLFLSVD